MTESRDDASTRALLERLQGLPAPSPDPAAAERTRARTRAAFVRAAERRPPAWLGAVGRAYARAEPAIATCLVLAYLAWALHTAGGLVR